MSRASQSAAAALPNGAPPPLGTALRSFATLLEARERDTLESTRRRAFERLCELGLPTLRDESWRYTNLRPLANQSYVDAPGDVLETADAASELAPDAAALVLVNGHPLRLGTAPGFAIRRLSEVSRHDPDLLRPYAEELTDAEEARWLLLNSALHVDGLHIRISGDRPDPLLILHLGCAEGPGSASFPRVIIEAAPGSRAVVIEHHVQRGAATPLANSATDLRLEPGARLEHYRVFGTGVSAVHLDSLRVRQHADSECRQFTATLGGAFVRAWTDARLLEPGARFESHSLLMGRERRHVDCVSVVEHAAPATVSHQTARAIASGASRVIFNTKVVVAAGAARSESQQNCRGLLLSPTAEIDSRPQLEIHTDEVKCAHGATTGRLDPNMFFYLLSRGLDRATAQSLLVYAFLGEVLTGMSVASARAAVEEALIGELPDSKTLRDFR